MSQRLEALAGANRRRREIANIKGALASLDHRTAAVAVYGMLLYPDETIGAIPVEDLLQCVRRVGREQCSRLLAQAGVSRVLRVREVSPGRRERLAQALASLAHGEDAARRTA